MMIWVVAVMMILALGTVALWPALVLLVLLLAVEPHITTYMTQRPKPKPVEDPPKSGRLR